MRRPIWFGAGVATGVAGTVWVELRLRRRVRRALALLSPSFVDSEAWQGAREAMGRLRDAVEAARTERHRRAREVRRREMVRQAAPMLVPRWPKEGARGPSPHHR